MGLTAFLAERDWTGLLAVLWIMSFFVMLGWTVYTFNVELFREIVLALGTPTALILKYYYDRQKTPE